MPISEGVGIRRSYRAAVDAGIARRCGDSILAWSSGCKVARSRPDCSWVGGVRERYLMGQARATISEATGRRWKGMARSVARMAWAVPRSTENRGDP